MAGLSRAWNGSSPVHEMFANIAMFAIFAKFAKFAKLIEDARR